MRFYHRTRDHKFTGIQRSKFNVQSGRVKLAIERLQDLKEEFFNDPDLAFTEGIIRLEYLGQWNAARELFENAYNWGNNDAASARNLAVAARDEQEFLKWAKISEKQSGKNRAHSDNLAEIKCFIEKGIPYWHIVKDTGEQQREAKAYGSAAAFMEQALFHVDKMSAEEELAVRKVRAQCLRALDKEASLKRTSQFEEFPPDERLTLHQAIAEIDRALLLDEYDPELWNFKSAWCNMMERYEESIQCANKAIELRPHHYPRPHNNKGDVFLKQKKYREAHKCAEEALKLAEGTEFLSDIKLAERIIQVCSNSPSAPTINDMSTLIASIFMAAERTCDQEYGLQDKEGPKYELKSVIDGAYRRAVHVRDNPMLEYIPMMAELLDDFNPETACFIMSGIHERDSSMFGYCMVAAQYVAVHSDRALKRDAARFLCLSILNGENIRAMYRQVILEPSAASNDKMSGLSEIIREELGRLNQHFPKLITEQEPIDEMGIERARRNILSLLPSDPSQIPIKRHQSQGPHGCFTAVLGLLLFLTTLLIYFVLR
jgi:Flp pilus assembly protein TadD